MAKGFVSIVGAGIGDRDLITLRGQRALEQADVIIYDRLLDETLLTPHQGRAELIFAGKEASNHYLTQEETNQLVLQKALEGKRVVRLKGGDPYVFGRGGEEAELLSEAGIKFEVIPGITAGVAALLSAGIPATHRDASTSISLITGHRKKGVKEDFTVYGQLPGTLVFYMGLNNLQKITQDLLLGGMNPDMPAAVIMKGGSPEQRVFTSTLRDIAAQIQDQGFGSPSLIVFGEVIRYREVLNFFEYRPLFGKKIAITRTRTQNSKLREALGELGAQVYEMPVIELIPVNTQGLVDRIKRMDYGYLVLHSPFAAELFIEEYLKIRDIRDLKEVKICVLGEKTGEVFRRMGIKPDIMPERYIGDALVEALRGEIQKGEKLFLPHSNLTRKTLLEAYEEMAELDALVVYENHRPESVAPLPNGLDYVLFTSASTVENFIQNYEAEALKGVKVISIGPITSDALRSHGLHPHREAKRASLEDMIENIKEDVECE